ncbi:unnamed protein product, partial [Mesorhabditis belari]|uniref:Uncharacterized protein n=1 Tax=Mesorhabditis belari TaxID=2138241 RepID=A0AAF3FBQ0_9BILA
MFRVSNRPLTVLGFSLLFLATFPLTEGRTRRHRSLHSSEECMSTSPLIGKANALLSARKEQGRSVAYIEPDNQHAFRATTESSVADEQCNVDGKTEQVLPGQPVRERALCPFRHVLNYDPKRVPASIVEVECMCLMPHSSKNPDRFSSIRCEPMYYSMRVLRFDSACTNFVEDTQRVAMGCTAVFASTTRDGTAATTGLLAQGDMPV